MIPVQEHQSPCCLSQNIRNLFVCQSFSFQLQSMNQISNRSTCAQLKDQTTNEVKKTSKIQISFEMCMLQKKNSIISYIMKSLIPLFISLEFLHNISLIILFHLFFMKMLNIIIFVPCLLLQEV